MNNQSSHVPKPYSFTMAPGVKLLAFRSAQPKVERPVRVLIADDDTLVRGSLAAVLECEGFEVEEAQNGIEAVTQAAQSSPDLILLDLNMPKLDGWSAFKEINAIRPLIPVIVITARPHQYQEALRNGADAFMEKPLDVPSLLRAIRKLTGEPEKRRRRTGRNSTWLLLTKPDHE